MKKHVHVSMLMEIEVSEKQYDDLMQNGAPEVWMYKHLANKLRGPWHLDGCELAECADAFCPFSRFATDQTKAKEGK